jgi:AcrR family transcriptional regulator
VPRRLTTDVTRARILAEALHRFSEQGYANTSTREIAYALGLTKAALYYHFATKDDILDALIAEAFANIRALVEHAGDHTSPQARRCLLAEYINITAEHQDLIRLVTQDPSARARLIRGADVRAKLLSLLAGVPDPDTAQRTRVRAAFGAIHAAVRFGEQEEDPQTVRQVALVAACGALGIPAPRTAGPPKHAPMVADGAAGHPAINPGASA